MFNTRDFIIFKVDRQVVACHSRSKWQLLSAK